MKKGFTLIELLVVIAIISLLSSVVLASLNSARNKGADASVKSNLSNIMKQAEIIYDPTGSYAGVCADNNVKSAMSAAVSASGGTWTSVANNTRDYNCTNAAGTWVAVVKLKTSGWWCVDNRGIPIPEAAQPPLVITACP